MCPDPGLAEEWGKVTAVKPNSPLVGLRASLRRLGCAVLRRPTASRPPRLLNERGLALPMALGISVVLMISVTAAIDYTVSTSRSSGLSTNRISAYALAEAGLNNALAVLNNPATDPLQQASLPSSEASAGSQTITGGTVKWWGVLTGHTWKLSGLGLVQNHTAVSIVRRSVGAYVDISTNLTETFNTHTWDYIMSTATGNTCDQTIADGNNTGNPVTVAARLYVFGNLCVGTSQGGEGVVSVGPVIVKGKVAVNSSNSYVGTSGSPVSELHVAVGCKYASGTQHSPCQNTTDHVFSTMAPDTTTPAVTAPVPQWDTWYANALGPMHPCSTSSGTGLPTWDTNTTRDNSVPAVWNMTPNTSYSCTYTDAGGSVVGSLAWDATNKQFTINGTMFVDGSASITNGALNKYQGQGTLYLSGTLLINNGSKLCALTSGSTCDFTSWNPNTEMFAIIVNGTGGQDPAGVSVWIYNSAFEGALYGTGKIRPEGTSAISGPMVASEVELGYNVSTGGQSISFPALTTAPIGLPGIPNAHATVSPPRSFSG